MQVFEKRAALSPLDLCLAGVSPVPFLIHYLGKLKVKENLIIFKCITKE